MPPVAGRGLMDQAHFDRQLGCMSGFLNLFDRHQILARKRLPAPPPPPSQSVARSTSPSPSEMSDASLVSVAFARESLWSPPTESYSPAQTLPLSNPVPLFEVRNGSRSSLKPRDAPRFSLDGCALVDCKGKLRARGVPVVPPAPTFGEQFDASEAAEESEGQRRAPSVVARLMGLDALPEPAAELGGGVSGRAELRRCVSESRVPRHSSYYRFLDGGTLPKRSPADDAAVPVDEFVRSPNLGDFRVHDAKKPKPPTKTSPLPPLQRKSFFDAEDFFPEPKMRGSLPIELEKRHLMEGMDEAARDLETLKQILEVLHLKGLLHSKLPDRQINGRQDHLSDRRNRLPEYSPIVVIEPVPSPSRRPSTEPRPSTQPRSGSGRQTPLEDVTSSPARQNPKVYQHPDANSEKKNRGQSSPVKRRSLNLAESGKTPLPRRRMPVVNPPKTPPNLAGPTPIPGRPPPIRRQKQEIAPKRRIPTQAEANAAATRQMDSERSWTEECRAGQQQLLERCDRLLHSIAAFTAAEQLAGVSASAAAEQQPSPVSVLDAPVLSEESPPRSPVFKRSINFDGDQLLETENDAIASSIADGLDAQEQQEEEEVPMLYVDNEGDNDYVYVAEILRATDRHGDATDIQAILEKRLGVEAPDAGKSRHFHRRLVFDAVSEILDQKRCTSAPPWETFVRPGSISATASGSRAAASPLLQEVWAELRRAREPVSADDVNVITCIAAGRDLAREDVGGWARPAAELADAAIQIERQIFKDLVDGAIRDLADASVVVRPPRPYRRKPVR